MLFVMVGCIRAEFMRLLDHISPSPAYSYSLLCEFA